MRGNANARMIKQINTGTLLKTIRTRGPLSRADLVKITKLSPTTVSVLVEELLQDKLVKEVGTGESSGGRRPILLEFEPKSRLAVGIAVGVKRTVVGLVDLEGDVVTSLSFQPDLTTKRTFLDGIITHTARLLKSVKDYHSAILGIGVATPGLLSSDRETLVYSSSLGLTDVPLYKELSKRFAFPIRIENDMNAAALGEKVMGAGKSIKDLIYISVETGIGAGIILNNQVHSGASGRAGELGHTTVEPNGVQCKCGNKGCLGVMAGEPAMLSRALHSLAMGTKTQIRGIIDNDLTKISLAVLVQAAKQGDAVAQTIIYDCMDYLAIGVANLINMFDPAVIILGGEAMDELGDLALNRVRESVSQRILPSHESSASKIIPSQLKSKVGLVGASTLIFSEFLQYVDVLEK